DGASGEARGMRDRPRVRAAPRPLRSALPGLQPRRDAVGRGPAHRESRGLRVPAAHGGGVSVGREVSRSHARGRRVPRYRGSPAHVRDRLRLPRRQVDSRAVTRLEEQHDLLARARTLLPYSRAPYSAHVKLRYADGRESDMLLGGVFRRGAGITILDWRTAPLAEVFFAWAEGEEYEVDLGDRKLGGIVLQRNLVRFEQGELVELSWPGGTLAKVRGEWRPQEPALLPRLLPRPHGQRARPASPVDVELDAGQRAVVELPQRETVLILGEAGCGKTTVALHRLRALRRAGHERFRAACIVPNEGLRRLTESLLHRLGLDDVETWTWDKFASKQARRVFPDLRRRESEDTPPLVSRLKRHEAIRAALAAIARRPPPAPGDESPRPARWAGRDDLHALFGDRPLMGEVASRAGLPVTAAAEAVEHARIQFTQSTERE